MHLIIKSRVYYAVAARHRNTKGTKHTSRHLGLQSAINKLFRPTTVTLVTHRVAHQV